MVLSIRDGAVVRVSPNITEVLGFPEELVVGNSFIDFVNPRDSVHVSSKFINGMSLSRGEKSLTPFYCRVREYQAYESRPTIDVREMTSYQPCKITLKFNTQTEVDERELLTSIPSFRLSKPDVLFAEVIPVPSFYKVPNEVINEGNFVIRHTASCNFSEYDTDAIPFLGHLPQDLTGNSIFDCYHPEDLPLLLTIYKEIIREHGKPFRSEAYRFRTFNGSWVVLETEWLSFVNPWTKKIDSIIGQHKVLKGPGDISIYMEQCDGHIGSYSEEVCIMARKARRDIIELLSKPVMSDPDQVLQQDVRYSAVSPMQDKNSVRVPRSTKGRTLAEMMSSLVNDIHTHEMKNIAPTSKSMPVPVSGTNPIITSASINAPHNSTANNGHTTQRHQTLNPADHPPTSMAGPQAGKGESLLSSSESPSTYSRLNYSATMLRFFQSNPRTASTDASAESKMELSAQGSVDEGKSTSMKQQFRKFSSSAPFGINKQLYMSGYGSGSGDTIYLMRKYGSKDITDSGSGESASGPSSSSGGQCSNNYTPVPLTEAVLTRHNQEMQMLFLERQRKNTIVANSQSKQKEKIKQCEKIQHLEKSTQKSSKCRMKRSCPRAAQEEVRHRKYAYVDHSHCSGEPGLSGMRKNVLQMNNATKPTMNSFHSAFSSRIGHQPKLTDLQPATTRLNLMSGPYFTAVHQLPTRGNAFNDLNMSSNSHMGHDPSHMGHDLSHISHDHHQLNHPSHQNHFPIGNMMMGPHQTHYLTPQGLAIPIQYMGGYPGMYIPPAFNSTLYGTPQLMMSNMMLPHPFIQQQPSRVDTLHASQAAHNPNTRLSDHGPEYNIVGGPQNERPVQQHQQRLPEQQDIQHHQMQQQQHSLHQQHQQQLGQTPSLVTVHLHKRSDSRATSVKVEPGSVLSSVASASGQLRCSMSHPPESLRSEVDDTAPTYQGLLYVPRVPSQATHFSRSTSVLGEAETIASPDKRQLVMDDEHGENNSDMVMSICSPAEDSMQLLSGSSVDSNEGYEDRPILLDPAWLDSVDVTPQLLYRYQLHSKELVDMLKQDMDALKHLDQPGLVEDQLSSLYQELEIDGDHLHLDEGITTSSSAEDMLESSTKDSSDNKSVTAARRTRSSSYFVKQALVHEVDAAVPPPDFEMSQFKRQNMIPCNLH